MIRSDPVRRCALVLSGCRSVPPPGIDADAYAEACLTDSYEVIAQMSGITAGLVGESAVLEEIRWPEDILISSTAVSARPIADRLTGCDHVYVDHTEDDHADGDHADDDHADGDHVDMDRVAGDRVGDSDHDFDELILLPADAPDLPELIIAKIAKALSRADFALAPEIGGPGLAAMGVRLPWPDWHDGDLDLDTDPYDRLQEQTPRRNLVVHTPGWHRMRTPEAVHQLDPSLEGWDTVRLLLSGHPSRL